MNLYLVETLDKIGYGDYAGVVVCAEMLFEAKDLAKHQCHNFTDNLSIRLLGDAIESIPKGVVLYSFNAR